MNRFYKKLIAHLGIALAVVGTLGGGIFFLGSKIEAYNANLKLLRLQFGERLGVVSALAELRTRYKEASNAQERLRSMIPQKDRLIDISNEFRVLAIQHNVGYSFSYIEEIPPSPTKLGSIKFHLTLDGALDKLAGFVRVLANFHYLTAIDNIALDANRMGLDGEVFFR